MECRVNEPKQPGLASAYVSMECWLAALEPVASPYLERTSKPTAKFRFPTSITAVSAYFRVPSNEPATTSIQYV